MVTYESEKKRYEAAGQGHVFRFWDKLSPEDQSTLLANASAIDIDRASRVFKQSVQAESSEGSSSAPVHDHTSVKPLPEDALDSTIGDEPSVSANVAQWRKTGLQAIADNKVGVLLMAGGQGTRLGSSDPKGCYDIGLPSHKPLFQIQAERIARLEKVAESETGKPSGSVTIPWYVMTSGPTRPATEAFFEKHKFFGLRRSNVIIFEQGTLPCFEFDGKVIMSSPSEIATAPDGNGGLYAGMRSPISSSTSNTVIKDLASRGIEYVHAYAVDNCLVRTADPIFLGYSISKKADCAAKVVRKLSPTESVGVVAMKGSVFSVVEYSEISQEQAERKDPHKPDQLAFRAANIVNHFYTRSFLEREEEFEQKMAFHIAKKKIPFVAEDGTPTKPSKPNGIKLELFVFDVFPYAEHMQVLEVERKEEFSPLKNAPGTGSDDPETSRADILAQQRRFLEAAGAVVPEDVVIEVSPLVSYAGEGLEAIKGKTFKKSGTLESLDDLKTLM